MPDQAPSRRPLPGHWLGPSGLVDCRMHARLHIQVRAHACQGMCMHAPSGAQMQLSPLPAQGHAVRSTSVCMHELPGMLAKLLPPQHTDRHTCSPAMPIVQRPSPWPASPWCLLCTPAHHLLPPGPHSDPPHQVRCTPHTMHSDGAEKVLAPERGLAFMNFSAHAWQYWMNKLPQHRLNLTKLQPESVLATHARFEGRLGGHHTWPPGPPAPRSAHT